MKVMIIPPPNRVGDFNHIESFGSFVCSQNKIFPLKLAPNPKMRKLRDTHHPRRNSEQTAVIYLKNFNFLTKHAP